MNIYWVFQTRYDENENSWFCLWQKNGCQMRVFSDEEYAKKCLDKEDFFWDDNSPMEIRLEKVNAHQLYQYFLTGSIPIKRGGRP